jgi:hypothetical protein
MRRRRGDVSGRIALCASLLLVVLAVPSTAHADFTPVGTISEPGRVNTFEPQVAVNRGGNAIFVWKRRDVAGACPSGQTCFRIHARARSAAGTLSAIQILSAAGQEAGSPDVALDDAGNAIFVWQRLDGSTACDGRPCQRIQARVRAPNGSLSATRTLSGPGRWSYFPQVEVDVDGNAVFLWRTRDGTGCGEAVCYSLRTRALSPDRKLSAVQTVSAAAELLAELAVTPQGDAVFVWEKEEGTSGCGVSGCTRIQTRARSTDGTLSPIQTLSASNKNAFFPHVAVDADGDAIFVWESEDATNDCNSSGCTRIRARVRTAEGALSGVQTLSANGRDSLFGRVAVDAGGNAVIAWQEGIGSCFCTPVRARARSADGTLGPIQVLSEPGRYAGSAQVVMDAGGNAVLFWQRNDGTTDCGGTYCFRIQARSRSAAGVLSPIETLSDAGHHASAPAVAADPDGGLDPYRADAVAAWQSIDGDFTFCCHRIQAAAQTASGGP